MHLHFEFDSANHKVVASGSVISFNQDPLTLTIPLEGEDLCFVFSFVNSQTEEDRPSLRAVPHGDRKLELQLVNFDYDLGTGNVNPIEIGVMDGKKLFLNYRVYSLSDSESRLLHYTFYQEK